MFLIILFSAVLNTGNSKLYKMFFDY